MAFRGKILQVKYTCWVRLDVYCLVQNAGVLENTAKSKTVISQVNFTPALGNDCSADVSVKLPMLVDMLNLAKQKMNLPRPVTESSRRRGTGYRNPQQKEGEPKPTLE